MPHDTSATSGLEPIDRSAVLSEPEIMAIFRIAKHKATRILPAGYWTAERIQTLAKLARLGWDRKRMAELVSDASGYKVSRRTIRDKLLAWKREFSPRTKVGNKKEKVTYNHSPQVLGEISDSIILLRPKLIIFAMGFTHNAALAEDLVHDAMERAFPKLQTLKSISGVQLWLWKIIRNTYINQLRSKGDTELESFEQRMERFSDNDPSMAVEPEYEGKIVLLEREAMIGKLHAAIEKLPTPYRAVMQLSYIEDRSDREIAGILGRAEVTVRSNLSRARKMLRAIVANDLETEDSPSRRQAEIPPQEDQALAP
jgi:RNA polymerase sigma-70 factor (ECF subfamily)